MRLKYAGVLKLALCVVEQAESRCRCQPCRRHQEGNEGQGRRRQPRRRYQEGRPRHEERKNGQKAHDIKQAEVIMAKKEKLHNTPNPKSIHGAYQVRGDALLKAKIIELWPNHVPREGVFDHVLKAVKAHAEIVNGKEYIYAWIKSAGNRDIKKEGEANTVFTHILLTDRWVLCVVLSQCEWFCTMLERYVKRKTNHAKHQ